MGNLYLGTSGYSYKDWRDIFYPKGVSQKSWMSFYAERYNSVEINATFYRSFPRSVFENWYERTPPPFRFTLKGPRSITHDKKLQDIGEELQQFVESSAGLREKLSVMLWQFSPGTKAEEYQALLAEFLPLLPTTIRQVFEFRHKSWFNDDIYRLLNQYHAGFVINDSSRWAAAEAITGDFMYVRFHGPKQLYASLYTPEQLSVWADKIKPNLQERDVYIYFNNDYGGRAIQNANELRDLLNT